MNSKINAFWNKYKFWISVIVFLIILGSLVKCNNDKINVLKGEYNVLNEQYKAEKDGVRIFEEKRIIERDSLNTEISRREKLNQELAMENVKLELQIKSIKDKPIVIPKDLNGFASYFNQRYKTSENEVINGKVAIGQSTAYDVTYELEEGDRCTEIIPLKDEQIKNQEQIIANQQRDKDDFKIQLVTAEKDIEQRKALEVTADKNIKNLETQVKKLNTKSTFNKILIPAAFVVGGFIGYEIAK